MKEDSQVDVWSEENYKNAIRQVNEFKKQKGL